MISEDIYEMVRVHSAPSAFSLNSLGLSTGGGIITWGPWNQEGSALISVLHSPSQWDWVPDRSSSRPWGELQALSHLALRGAASLWGQALQGEVSACELCVHTVCLTPCQKRCLSHFKILWEVGLNSLSHKEHLDVSEQSSDMTTEVFGVVTGNLNCTNSDVTLLRSCCDEVLEFAKECYTRKCTLVVRNVPRFPWIWPGPCMAFNVCRLRQA